MAPSLRRALRTITTTVSRRRRDAQLDSSTRLAASTQLTADGARTQTSPLRQ